MKSSSPSTPRARHRVAAGVIAAALVLGLSAGCDLDTSTFMIATVTLAQSGDPAPGVLLSAAALDSDGRTVTDAAFTWQRSSDNAAFTDISDETGSSFTIPAGYKGEYLRVKATNANTKGYVVSNNTIGPVGPFTYTVTFDKNGGYTEAIPATKTVTTPATTLSALPSPPTKTWYEFDGWNTQADGAGSAFTASTTVTRNLTVYAQWKPAAAAPDVYLDTEDLKDDLVSQAKKAGDDNTPANAYTVRYAGRESPTSLYDALAEAGQYVNLDLSESGVGVPSAPGFAYGTEEGRALIVELTLPNTLTAIPAGSSTAPTFNGFDNLTAVTAVNVKTVGAYAFAGREPLTTVTMPAATAVNDYAFQGCGITTVDLPAATTVGAHAFEDCAGLATVTLPRAAAINAYAFASCEKLGGVTTPGGTTSGGTTPAVTLPAATAIGDYAFENCGLTTASLDAAATVGAHAFEDCAALTTLSLLKAARINANAFAGCVKLSTVYLGSTPPTVGVNLFQDAAVDDPPPATPRTVTVKVPEATPEGAYNGTWKIAFRGRGGDAVSYGTGDENEAITVVIDEISGE